MSARAVSIIATLGDLVASTGDALGVGPAIGVATALDLFLDALTGSVANPAGRTIEVVLATNAVGLTFTVDVAKLVGTTIFVAAAAFHVRHAETFVADEIFRTVSVETALEGRLTHLVDTLEPFGAIIVAAAHRPGETHTVDTLHTVRAVPVAAALHN